MAKALPVPGIGKDDPFAAAAAKVVETRARELARNAAGVLDTADIERVHDMRVATRRLRAALEVFEPCFPKKRFRATLREVKELADALGERRDRDVTIAALDEYAGAIVAADRPGVRSLVERLRAEQADANLALAPFVTEQRIASLEAKLAQLVASARALAGEVDEEDEQAADSAPAAGDAAAQPVAERAASPPQVSAAPVGESASNGGEPR